MEIDSKRSFTICKLRFFADFRLAWPSLATFCNTLFSFGAVRRTAGVAGVRGALPGPHGFRSSSTPYQLRGSNNPDASTVFRGCRLGRSP
ncbi:hypothetical protein J057_24105 [Marinobacter nanhaiticus D15-8W]|uniref:Uncharacterized protein n=1 Tax=Marinobacter nanhaiticus D15-8W TaxID=626887 RepID=A0A371CGD4_9GAMM|nr:hypothetical protein J057_24105 [Marinobacter nanhaiticus D15-8W]